MSSQPHHLEEYQRRLHRVLAYIDQHLDEPVDLAALAKVAAFSPFHFHRLFAAHMGETVGNYLTRRRVETGAARLASQPRLGILAVSLEVGFGSPEAFARAFRRHFGCAPSRWRERKTSQRKRSQAKSSLDQAMRAEKGYARLMKTNPSFLRVTTQNRPSIRIAYLRYQGPFGERIARFWGEKAYPWMAANGLLGFPRYGICLDDPTITAKEQCRYDAGVEVRPDFVAVAGTQIATLPGGLYACTPFKGRADAIGQTWDQVLREWLPSSGFQLDARPYFEFYPIDSEHDEKSGVFSCQLCVPIAPL